MCSPHLMFMAFIFENLSALRKFLRLRRMLTKTIPRALILDERAFFKDSQGFWRFVGFFCASGVELTLC